MNVDLSMVGINNVNVNPLLVYIAAIIVFALLVYGIWKFFLKSIIINSIIGIGVLLIMKYVLFPGIPMDLPILAAVVLFGLPGVGAILVLYLGGVL